MSRIEEKVAAQRRLIAPGNGKGTIGDSIRPINEDADEDQLEKLSKRLDISTALPELHTVRLGWHRGGQTQ